LLGGVKIIQVTCNLLAKKKIQENTGNKSDDTTVEPKWFSSS